ncbi:MAG: hypothetical protein AVDCRST_MAG93-9781, partial [uncultured Chloroflexia bacterium]
MAIRTNCTCQRALRQTVVVKMLFKL